MWQRRIRSGRRNSHGVASIRRDSYNSVKGFTQKDGWWEIRAKVWKRDGGRCRVLVSGKPCGAVAEEVHHIVPLSKGGTTTMANLICICKTHHNQRHAHLFRSR
jgi:5-methylcytosine-specific restriction endonuclease McrA